PRRLRLGELRVDVGDGARGAALLDAGRVPHPHHCDRDAIQRQRRSGRERGRGKCCTDERCPFHHSSSGFSKNLLSAHTSRARSPSKRTPIPRSLPSSISSQRTWPSTSMASACVGTLNRSATLAPNGNV